MKDEKGLYFYPVPQNKRFRTYVREADGTIWFRLWNADDPKLWEEHGWIPYDAIKMASPMFNRNKFDPDQAYDIKVAEMVLAEHR